MWEKTFIKKILLVSIFLNSTAYGTTKSDLHECEYNCYDECYEDSYDINAYPRSLASISKMSGQQREKIFNEIISLKTQAMCKVNKAKDLQDYIVDVDIKACFTAILIDCIQGCSTGYPIASCITCAIELTCHKYNRTCEYLEARSLIKQAQRLYEKAEQLEEMLWCDDNAEDWM